MTLATVVDMNRVGGGGYEEYQQTSAGGGLPEEKGREGGGRSSANFNRWGVVGFLNQLPPGGMGRVGYFSEGWEGKGPFTKETGRREGGGA